MVELWFYLTLFYAFCHALVAVLDRKVYSSVPLSSLAYSSIRFFMNAAIAITFPIFFGLSLPAESIPSVFFVSLFYFLAAAAYFKAIKYGEVSQLIPYRDSISTTLSFLLAMFFLSEFSSALNAVGVFLIAAGGYIVWTDGKLAFPKKSLGIVLIAISAIFLSVSGVVSKIALKGVSPATLSFLMYGLVAIYFIFLNVVSNRKAFAETAASLLKNKKFLLIAFGASVAAVVGIFSFYLALQSAGASRVLPLAGTLPLFAALIGWLGLKEKHGPARFIGAVLIAIGAALVYL